MEKCKSLLLENGEIFLTKASEARGKIGRLASPWVSSDAVSKLKKIK
jgi:hypothetical protein